MSDTRTLYLRGLPSEVVRAAKIEAARRGVTLARLVAELIENATEHPRADARLPEALRADAAWYEENKRRLLKRYDGRYIAIVDRKVVDHDADFSELSKRVFAAHGPRPIFMPRCIRDDEVVRVRGPRVRSS